MTEQQQDLWAERRGELAVLVGQLQPEEALEVLRRVVEDCAEGRQVAPALMGTIRGIVERRGSQSVDRPSQQAYQAMKEHAPNIGDT
jgi:hypothetical protein